MMPPRRYPKYREEVNDLLDFAREVRRFAAKYPHYVNANDILQSIDRFAANWGWDLLDLVLDHEEGAHDRKIGHPRR